MSRTDNDRQAQISDQGQRREKRRREPKPYTTQREYWEHRYWKYPPWPYWLMIPYGVGLFYLLCHLQDKLDWSDKQVMLTGFVLLAVPGLLIRHFVLRSIERRRPKKNKDMDVQ